MKVKSSLFIGVIPPGGEYVMEVMITGETFFLGRIPVRGQGYGGVPVPDSKPTRYVPLLEADEPEWELHEGICTEHFKWKPLEFQLKEGETFPVTTYQRLLEMVFLPGFVVARCVEHRDNFASLLEVPIEEHDRKYIEA